MSLKLVLKIIVILSVINSIQCICKGSQSVLDAIDKLDQKLSNKMENILNSCIKPQSCAAVKAANPDSTSDFYDIEVDGVAKNVYCNFDTLCGSNGGWMRLGYLDMSDPSSQCPAGFTLQQANGKRTCGRDSIGCKSINIPSLGSYSEVCGRVQAYQFQHMDGLTLSTPDINVAYVDGVSITRGSPRKHIWTFIGSLGENGNAQRFDCPPPCGGTGPTPPAFVGSNYYCESGNPGPGHYGYYTNDAMWDGKQCGSKETGCCGAPYFHASVGNTADKIELRVCSDEDPTWEDARIFLYEIYVK